MSYDSFNTWYRAAQIVIQRRPIVDLASQKASKWLNLELLWVLRERWWHGTSTKDDRLVLPRLPRTILMLTASEISPSSSSLAITWVCDTSPPRSWSRYEGKWDASIIKGKVALIASQIQNCPRGCRWFQPTNEEGTLRVATRAGPCVRNCPRNRAGRTQFWCGLCSREVPLIASEWHQITMRDVSCEDLRHFEDFFTGAHYNSA